MNAEIFAALAQLEKERGIPQQYMIDKITQALVAAYKKDKEGYTDNVFVEVEDGDLKMYVQKEVVDDVLTPATEISLDAARKINKHAELGDLVNVDVRTQNFGRIAAQTAKQVIIQGIREGERQAMQEAYENKKEELMTATVSKINPDTGDVLLEMDRGVNPLPKAEQIPGETFTVGQKIKVYLTEINREARGPVVTLSRTHPGLVKRLFELEVPEIQEGTVLIKGVAREAGSRTKIAIWSRDPDVDAVGACIGTHNMRIDAILSELSGEKIDIVRFSEDTAEYVAAALAPATVQDVVMTAERACRVTVSPDQLSLAIGREGQNVRLAARLTGCKIDIKTD